LSTMVLSTGVSGDSVTTLGLAGGASGVIALPLVPPWRGREAMACSPGVAAPAVCTLVTRFLRSIVCRVGSSGVRVRAAALVEATSLLMSIVCRWGGEGESRGGLRVLGLR